MKFIAALPFLFLCPVAFSQVGATAGEVRIPKAVGEHIFTNCKVTKVEPDGVRISHDGGFAKVPYEYMPEVWQKNVSHNESEALAFFRQQNEMHQNAISKAESERAAATASQAPIQPENPKAKQPSSAVRQDQPSHAKVDDGTRSGTFVVTEFIDGGAFGNFSAGGFAYLHPFPADVGLRVGSEFTVRVLPVKPAKVAYAGGPVGRKTIVAPRYHVLAKLRIR